MSLRHDLRGETRQHLIRSIGGGDKQADLLRVAAPLFNTFPGCGYAESGSRIVQIDNSACEKIGVVLHDRITLVHAQTANGVDELRRKLVHQSGNEISGRKTVFRCRCGRRHQIEH